MSDEYEKFYNTVTSSNCYNADDCYKAKANFSSNAFLLRNLTKYGTLIEYQCPLAKEFYLADSGTTTKSQNISCEWNSKSWSPGVVFPPCVCKFIDGPVVPLGGRTLYS
jgi:hypothetical protein